MTEHRETPPVDGRRLIVVAVAASLIGLILMLSFGYANHAPAPHDVDIQVVAPPGVESRVAQGLDAASPGGFHVTISSSREAAVSAVKSLRADGALVVLASGPNEIITAGANSPSLQNVIIKALSASSKGMGRQVKSSDVVALPSDDRAGLSSFVLELGVVIPSVLGSVGLYLLGVRARLWVRVSAALLYAALIALLGLLVFNVIFGALTGAVGGLLGLAFFGALTFMLVVAACQAVLGVPGTGLAALALIFVGNAISGGTNPVPMMPDVYRQIAPWLPNNATVQGMKEAVYFNGNGIGHSLIVLGIWSLSSVVILRVVDILHQSERRIQPDAPTAQIYAQPGIEHVKRKAARRRARRSAEGKHEVHQHADLSR